MWKDLVNKGIELNYCLLSILVILVSLISHSFYLQQIFEKGNQATQQIEKSVKAKAATEVFRKNFPKLLETVEPPKLAASNAEKLRGNIPGSCTLGMQYNECVIHALPFI